MFGALRADVAWGNAQFEDAEHTQDRFFGLMNKAEPSTGILVRQAFNR